MKGWKMTNLVTIFVLHVRCFPCLLHGICPTQLEQIFRKSDSRRRASGGHGINMASLSIGVLLDSATYHSSKGGWSQGKFLEAVHNRRVGSHVVFMGSSAKQSANAGVTSAEQNLLRKSDDLM